jgi:hypothetical protein
MAGIVESVEIARRPMDVFSCATDFSRYPEWQGVSSGYAWMMTARPRWARRRW